jgi:hypothetical protein
MECELLITKNYFLASANAFFRSQNIENVKGVVFFEKTEDEGDGVKTYINRLIFLR